MILAEGQPIGGMVIPAFREKDEVRAVDEREAGIGQFDAQPAGSALEIVHFQNNTPKR